MQFQLTTPFLDKKIKRKRSFVMDYEIHGAFHSTVKQMILLLEMSVRIFGRKLVGHLGKNQKEVILGGVRWKQIIAIIQKNFAIQQGS